MVGPRVVGSRRWQGVGSRSGVCGVRDHGLGACGWDQG